MSDVNLRIQRLLDRVFKQTGVPTFRDARELMFLSHRLKHPDAKPSAKRHRNDDQFIVDDQNVFRYPRDEFAKRPKDDARIPIHMPDGSVQRTTRAVFNSLGGNRGLELWHTRFRGEIYITDGRLDSRQGPEFDHEAFRAWMDSMGR